MKFWIGAGILSFLLAPLSFSLPLSLLGLFIAVFIFKRTRILSIASREFKALFASFLGWLVFLGFMVVLCYLYEGAAARLDSMSGMSPYNLAPLSSYFHGYGLSIAFLLMIPTITMRLFAEERSNGTYELMLSYPVAEWHWIAGKFLGVFFYFLILWLPSFFHIFLLGIKGSLDVGQIFSVYFSLFLYTGAFLAIGISASCFFTSQLASFICTMILLLPFHGHIFWTESALLPEYFSIFSLSRHLEIATRGTIASFSFFLFFSIILLFLYIATRIIHAHRWFPGPFNDWVIKAKRKALAIITLCFFSASAFFLFVSMPWGILFAFLVSMLLCHRVFIREFPYAIISGSNSVLGVASCLAIVCMINYLSHFYESRLDWSAQKAFSLDSHVVSLLQKELPPGESIQAIALLGYSDQHRHEHTERDNERYFILKEMFRKVADSLNKPGEKRFVYEFLHPVQGKENVSDYLAKEKAQKEKIALLQNEYGLTGYREVLLLYKNRYYVLQDHELFEKKLTRQQVPRLLLLWKKIYESGGMIEAPSDDEEKAFVRLKEIANPEMLSVFPHILLEQNIINAILRLLKGMQRNVYFTQGQGEKNIAGELADDYKTAYRLGNIIRRENFSIRTLALGESGEIPQDCDILVILGTDRFSHFTAKSLLLLDRYFQKGGNILLCLEANTDGGLIDWAKKYGIEIQRKTFSFVIPGYKDRKSNIFALESFASHDSHPLQKMLQKMQEEENCSQPPYNQIIVGRSCPVKSMSPGIQSILFVPQRAIAYPIGAKEEPSRSIGAILEREKGGKLIVVGETMLTSDTPYYETGMQSPIPYMMLGSNRFIIPCLLEYMSKPIPIIPVTGKNPIFYSEDINKSHHILE